MTIQRKKLALAPVCFILTAGDGHSFSGAKASPATTHMKILR